MVSATGDRGLALGGAAEAWRSVLLRAKPRLEKGLNVRMGKEDLRVTPWLPTRTAGPGVAPSS